MSITPAPRLLELFAGSSSVGTVARSLGMVVRSVDIVAREGITDVRDILDMNVRVFKDWRPDIIWASPPCTGFSVASIGRHWTGGRNAYLPKSATAYHGMAMVRRTQEIIAACDPDVWFMENPRGVLRKLALTQGYGTHHTVTYCRYGDERMKPTDIWTNCSSWKPKEMCKKGAACHEAAPRGSRSGTQGMRDAFERSKIPPALCMDVLTAAMKQMKALERVRSKSHAA